MNSATAITYELDDIHAAAEELIQQIKEKLTFNKESIAILHAQPEMETKELSAILHERLGFPVIGGTTAAAATLSNVGYHEFAIMLHVMTADDCLFSAAISSSMIEQPKQCIIDTYHKALNGLNEKDALAQPKMIYCIASMIDGCSSDDILTILSDESQSLPIFGFNAADDFQFNKQQVFLNGVQHNDVIAILLIAGNIKPIFEVKNLAGSQHLAKQKITKAKGNIIYEIENKPAYEYLNNFEFITNDTYILWNYQFFVEMPNNINNDGISVSRALSTYDKTSGEITCFADVPQGSYIHLQYCKDSDVKNSCEEALTELKTKIDKAESNDYKYSTIIIASCSLRNMFLADQKDAEGTLVNKIIPDSLCVSGLYAFGEIAPTSVYNGKAVNRFHNATMAICAF